MITSAGLRQKFLDFFQQRGHKIVPSSPLLPSDPSVLFTTAGVQQFKEYYLGKVSPFGTRAVSSQKCLRTSDVDEVGDATHLTFFEMLGNFSFAAPADLPAVALAKAGALAKARASAKAGAGESGAGYFKKKAIYLAYEFLTSVLGIPGERLRFTVFGGENGIPEDNDSRLIWEKLGIPKKRIYGFGRKENFWGPTGEEGPCGPTTEIHYDLTQKSCPKAENCIPNCRCGRFIEVWNLVFNEYFQDRNKKLTPLPQKGVDTGMGLERLAMVVQKKNSIYETDLFEPIIRELRTSNLEPRTRNFVSVRGRLRTSSERSKRIIADHIKATVFLISEGIFPSNIERGYILRRLLRRAIRFGKLLNLGKNFLIPLSQRVIEIYEGIYPEIKPKKNDILTVIQNEEEKFGKTLERGLKNFRLQIEKCKLKKIKKITGEIVFDLYQSYGFPLELTKELAAEQGFETDEDGFKKEFKKHREISRAGAEKKFGGVGRDATLAAARHHTATHLLHAALREILGKHVKQMGSDITPLRLRFDFSHPRKMPKEELSKVEALVSQKIKENLEVKKEEMSYEEAISSGALAFFKEKYPERVTVYSICDSSGYVFSKEICAGPHAERTSELGNFKIIKEESSGAGVRRIRAVLE